MDNQQADDHLAPSGTPKLKPVHPQRSADATKKLLSETDDPVEREALRRMLECHRERLRQGYDLRPRTRRDVEDEAHRRRAARLLFAPRPVTRRPGHQARGICRRPAARRNVRRTSSASRDGPGLSDPDEPDEHDVVTAAAGGGR